jgi:hypothetical protein
MALCKFERFRSLTLATGAGRISGECPFCGAARNVEGNWLAVAAALAHSITKLEN